MWATHAHIRACDIRDALHQLPELRHLAADADAYGALWERAEGLDKLPRGMAMHPCGVILSNNTLLDRLPIQPTPGGYPMVRPTRKTSKTSPCSSLMCWGCGCSRRWRTPSPRSDAPPAGRSTWTTPSPGRPVRVRTDPGLRHRRHVPAGFTRPAGPRRPAPAPRPPGRHRRHLPVPARPGIVSALAVSRAGRVSLWRGHVAGCVPGIWPAVSLRCGKNTSGFRNVCPSVPLLPTRRP